MEDSGFNKVINKIKELKNKKENFVSLDVSRELAKNLLEKYKDKIWENHGKDVDCFDNGEIFSDFQKSIRYYLSQTSDEVKKQYVGHGITKGNEVDQLAGALNILANGYIKGEVGELKSDYISAYDRGNFIVISPKNENLVYLEKNGEHNLPVFNKISAWKANIGAFVVDVKYYPLINELKRLFPNVNIIKANELKNYLK